MIKVSFKGCLVIVMCLSLLSIGAVRKKTNYVLKTQTDPISLKQKLEEMKNGVKGAPSPSMEFYGNQEFLVDPPVEDPNKVVNTVKSRASSTSLEPSAEEARYEESETGTWWDDVYDEEESDAGEVWGATDESEEEDVNWWSDE